MRLVATDSKSTAVDFTEILPAGSGDRRVRVSEYICLGADALKKKFDTHPPTPNEAVKCSLLLRSMSKKVLDKRKHNKWPGRGPRPPVHEIAAVNVCRSEMQVSPGPDS